MITMSTRCTDINTRASGTETRPVGNGRFLVRSFEASDDFTVVFGALLLTNFRVDIYINDIVPNTASTCETQCRVNGVYWRV